MRIDGLSRGVAERDGRIDAFEHSIAEHEEQVRALKRVVAERDEQTEALNNTVAEYELRIDGLSRGVAERDGRIDAFEHSIAEHEEQVRALKRAVAERDEQTEALNSTVAEYELRIDGLSRGVAERDGRIDALHRHIAMSDGRLQELERTIVERDEQPQELDHTYSSRIEELTQTVSGGRNQVEHLKQAVSERGGQIDVLNKLIDLREPTTQREGVSVGFFSICAKNYIPYARTLYHSLRVQYHDAKFYLVLADRADGYLELDSEEFPILEAQSIGIDDFDGMAFRYDITEFNTAIKPSCFEYLFKRYEHDALVYLDPDVYVVNRMAEVERHLAEGTDIVLTPHICFPTEDGDKPDDLTLLRNGIYNLGFLALANTDQVKILLRWWDAHLKHDCRMELKQGLHVDQQWMDLAPGFIERTKILHHEEYNVAYWNLMHRKIRNTPSGWLINGSPLIFVHFSGIDPSDANVLSNHQSRFNSGNIGDLKELLREYLEQVKEHGHAEFSILPYTYDYSVEGHKIHSLVRRIYREEVECSGPQADPWRSALEFAPR